MEKDDDVYEKLNKKLAEHAAASFPMYHPLPYQNKINASSVFDHPVKNPPPIKTPIPKPPKEPHAKAYERIEKLRGQASPKSNLLVPKGKV